MDCVVSQDFKAVKGRVRLGDTTYAAVGPDELAAGQIVRITQTRGSTLVVEPTSTQTSNEGKTLVA